MPFWSSSPTTAELKARTHVSPSQGSIRIFELNSNESIELLCIVPCARWPYLLKQNSKTYIPSAE